MSKSTCDNCHKEFSESKDKYKLKCSGDCRRIFCLECTGLDKAGAKLISMQKNSKLKYFCFLCDSPNLKYLHEKVTNLAKKQIPQENFEALGTHIKKLTDAIPTITELHDVIYKSEEKWQQINEKTDKICQLLYTLVEEGSGSITKSLREMKQDLFLLTSTFFDNDQGPINVQIHNPSSSAIKTGIDGILKKVDNITKTVSEVDNKLKALSPTTALNPTTNASKTVKMLPQKTVQSSTPPLNKPHEPQSTNNYEKVNKWHYVIVNNLPPYYTSTNIVHYVKEKLGVTDFIRCYTLLNPTNMGSFKVGITDKRSAELMANNSFWPANISVRWSQSTTATCNQISGQLYKGFIKSDITSTASVAETIAAHTVNARNSSEKNKLTISSDSEAIAACKSNVINQSILVELAKRETSSTINIDPLTPPRVRLTQEAQSTFGRTLLARLREPLIMNAIRLHLAYLSDQSNTVCYDGFTNTSIKLYLASEGLPVDLPSLKKLYNDFHAAYNIAQNEVTDDLLAYRSYITSERIAFLQKCRETQRSYQNPLGRNF
jgi:hypothetical protein